MPVGELLERRCDEVGHFVTRERIDLRLGIVRVAQVLAHPERGVRWQEFVVNRLRQDRAEGAGDPSDRADT